jgi:hypothetical protein
MPSGEQEFDALAGFAQGLYGLMVAAGQAKREQRNARRRARYIPRARRPSEPKPAAVPLELDDEPEQVCTCYRSAPCWYCTEHGGGWDE